MSYAIIRGGIADHLLAGRLGFFELGIYAMIHLQANFRAGVWWGSAPRLVATAPAGTNLRDVQRALQTLTTIGFLRPFHVQGARGNYPVLIDKYHIRTGALTGRRLIASKSNSWQTPYYEACAEAVAEPDADADTEAVAEAAPIQYSVCSKQESSPAAVPRDADSRYQPFFDHVYQSFEKRHSVAPTWNGKHHRALQQLLKENHHLSFDELKTRWANYLASPDAFIRSQGDSLAYFCGNIDRFLEAPQIKITAPSSAKGRSHARDFSQTDNAAQRFLDRSNELGPKVGADVLHRKA